MHEHSIVNDLAWILFAAAVAALALHRFKIPLLIGYIVAGFLVGPHLGLALVELDNVQELSELGVIFLLFYLGLEFDFGRLKRMIGPALTALALQTLLMLFLGGIEPGIAVSIMLTGLAVNFFLSVLFAGAMHDVFNQIASHQNEVSHYVDLFDMVGEFESQSPFLKKIQSDLTQDGDDVRRHVGSLSCLAWLANLRRNGIFFLPYLVLEFMFFWDETKFV